MRVLTWSNLISLARIPAAALFWVSESVPLRLGIALAVAASDGVDGWLARNMGQRSKVGAVLDPITDKLFVLTALVSFAAGPAPRIELWELLVLLARDLYVTAGFIAALVLRLPIDFAARFGGKVVTVLQIAAVLVLLAFPAAEAVLIATIAVASAYAIVDYTRAGLRSLRRPEPSP